RGRGAVFFVVLFFFSSRRRHTSFSRDWSSDVCSSDLDLHDGALDDVAIVEVLDRLVDGGEEVLLRPDVVDGDLRRGRGGGGVDRSEERRVGKECRSMWSAAP